MLIDGNDLRVSQQRQCPRISCSQFATQHKRRWKHYPEGHQHSLFIVAKPGIARLAPSRSWPKAPEGEHVSIRPMSGFGFARPFGNVLELIAKSFRIRAVVMPNVPN